MSADNWAACPKCLANAIAARDKAIDEAAKQYGKIYADAWKEMDEKAHKAIRLENTLREDYNIGVDKNGLFDVCYTAACVKCNFTFTYEFSKDLSGQGT